MVFLKTNINNAILLNDDLLRLNKLNNIDYINNLLLPSVEMNEFLRGSLKNDIFEGFLLDEKLDLNQKKLLIINLAGSLCEKFHSYFHFEGAYLYFFFANFLMIQKNWNDYVEKIIAFFNASIKQFRFNKLVHLKLIQFYEENLLDNENTKLCIDRFNSLFDEKYNQINSYNFEYRRQFETFRSYIKFATNISDDDLL